MFQFIDYETKKYCEGGSESKWYVEKANQRLKKCGLEEIVILEIHPMECKNINNAFLKTDVHGLVKIADKRIETILRQKQLN